jgi:hypothetical protein
MLRTCSRIIALTAMVAGPTAEAADTTLTLACQGTKTYTHFEGGGTPRRSQPDPISMGIIVNLTDRTVTGLEDEPPLTIRSVNETTIAFGWFWDSKDNPFKGVTTYGTIDRLTGDMAATRTEETGTNWTSRSTYLTSYSLKCRPTQRMF